MDKVDEVENTIFSDLRLDSFRMSSASSGASAAPRQQTQTDFPPLPSKIIHDTITSTIRVAPNFSANNDRQTVYQRGTQRDGSPHYVFLYSDDESGDEEILLQPRNSNSVPRKVEVMNITLKSDDTLQALALRYRCTISELKRINNIHKENEIFARRVIKVPIQPFSIFTENNEASDNLLDKIERNIASEEQITEKREEEIINLIATPIVPPVTSINSVILNSICEPSNGAEDAGTRDGESDTLLRESQETNDVKTVDPFRCSGADWGLSWAHLLGFSLLLGFAGPVIYIFYIAENEHKHSAT